MKSFSHRSHASRATNKARLGRHLVAVMVLAALVGLVVGNPAVRAKNRLKINSSAEGKKLAAAPVKSSGPANGPHSAQTGSREVKGMIQIPAGTFWMGCNERTFKDVRPIHQVRLNGFWMDKTPVTNDEFARFVSATSYKTVAERKPDAKDFPGAPPENLVAGALVFVMPTQPVSKHSHYNWWRYIPGADWRHPEGPDTSIKDKGKHPVVQIAWEDANAYAKWAGKRLPTEAEFEYAARGGLDRQLFSWGNEFKPNGKWQANIWQGVFPYENACEDGFRTTAPVCSYAPNNYGLYDMTGNVWEWCSDWYRPDYYQSLGVEKIAVNPKGPDHGFDPAEPAVPKRVQRGGSFLCTDQYCARYLVGARGKGEPSSGCNNVGFRCVKNDD